MRQRISFAAIWFWGFWSLGATLDFFAVAPEWPALVVGAFGAAAALGFMRVPEPFRRTAPATAPNRGPVPKRAETQAG